nr:carboxylesterase family protein [Paenibacillus taichungensis]
MKHRQVRTFQPQTLQQTTYGPIDGRTYEQFGTLGWLGVPYASPPVGELRWKAPREPEAWMETRSAKEFAASSLQLSGIDTTGSEDSLYLNIWRPDTISSKLPVMVFLHGGGNMTGSGKDFQGEQLARNTNSIIVSVNYRLGALGFFQHAALKTGNALDDSGNYGLLDALRALRGFRII